MPPVEGSRDVTVQTRVQVQRKQIEITNCETNENMHWVLSTVEDTTILSKDLSSFFPEDSYSILGKHTCQLFYRTCQLKFPLENIWIYLSVKKFLTPSRKDKPMIIFYVRECISRQN